MGKINDWIRKNFAALALATSSVEKDILGQSSQELEGGVGQHQRLSQGTLMDALIQGEITQEVKDLRWRTFKVLEASDKMQSKSVGVDSEGYRTMETTVVTDDMLKAGLRKIKVDDADNYDLELVVKNEVITKGVEASMGVSGLEVYDLDERKASVTGTTMTTFNDEGEAIKEEAQTVTLGKVDNDRFQSDSKGEKPVIVERSIRAKFNIEDYTKKLNIRKINDTERLLEFYLSKYPDEYDRKTNLLISEIKRAIQNPRVSDILDIDKVGFVSYKTIGVKDFREFQYEVKSFDKIVEFNGHYVIKFKCDVTVNGEYLLEKFREEELDEKYKNKEVKK